MLLFLLSGFPFAGLKRPKSVLRIIVCYEAATQIAKTNSVPNLNQIRIEMASLFPLPSVITTKFFPTKSEWKWQTYFHFLQSSLQNIDPNRAAAQKWQNLLETHLFESKGYK